MQPLERSITGAVGAALAAAGLRSRSGLEKLVLGGLGAGLIAVAARRPNPLATALKIEQNHDGDTVIPDALTNRQTAGHPYST